MFSLHARRAVITGAGSGIGAAIAEQFAGAGAAVVLVDRDEEAVTARARTLAGTGAQATSVACDIAQEQSVEEAFAGMGAMDILVNCAGIAHVGTLESTGAEELDRLYAVNVRGTYLCMRSALRTMLPAGRGIVLNMASVAATAGLSDRFAYSMTKGAVVAMTLSVARDYVGRGVRCNCISPARVHTAFVDGFLARNYPGEEAERFEALARAQPIGRMGTAAEVAALALFLCSDEASFITGANYLIDGGFMNLR